MQPLNKVKNVQITDWGLRPALLHRKELAAQIAHCIAQWAEIEAMLGIFTALLLHANDAAILAMYGSLENRTSQMKMLSSAVDSVLKDNHADIVNVIIKDQIKPAMKTRDRFAHWCWGLSDELEDALLIRAPADHLESFYRALKLHPNNAQSMVATDHSTIYVIREPDITRFTDQLISLQLNLRYAMGSVWNLNDDERRAALLQTLSTLHPIPEGLKRLDEARQKNQKAPPSPPEEETGEKP